MTASARTANDDRMLHATLRALGVDDNELSAGTPLFRAATLQRHELLMSAGEPARDCGLIVEGVLREYYVLHDGTERTRAFLVEGDAFGSAADALSRRPLRVFCRAQTPVRVLLLRWDELFDLAGRLRGWERLQARIVERLYLQKAEREFELLALDAMARYQRFRLAFPDLEQRVEQHLVASYLGITPVHLSRLRARQRRASLPALTAAAMSPRRSKTPR
jgi:CRP-like cAMP-binding protein